MSTATAYRSIRLGVETMPARLVLPRHRHREGYANVALEGAFAEASFAGCFSVTPGEVLLHGAFDCHANTPLGARGPRILRLPWFDDAREGRFRVRDPDRLARVAERDPLAAAGELAEMVEPLPDDGAMHWTASLAAALRADPSLPLAAWAERHGLAPATVSRGFARAFGTSPRQFRLELRTRRAWRAVLAGRASLTAIAHDAGFADLAHMCRSVRRFTGLPPSAWRAPHQLRSSGVPPALVAYAESALRASLERRFVPNLPALHESTRLSPHSHRTGRDGGLGPC